MLTNLQSGKPISPEDENSARSSEESLLTQAGALAEKDSTVNMLLLLTKKMQTDLTDYLNYTERFTAEMQALHQATAEQLRQASGERNATLDAFAKTQEDIRSTLQKMLAAEAAAQSRTSEMVSSLSRETAAELAVRFDEYVARAVDQHIGELEDRIRDSAEERARCIAETRRTRRRTRLMLLLCSASALLSLAAVALLILKL